jgi:hypothetical protein
MGKTQPMNVLYVSKKCHKSNPWTKWMKIKFKWFFMQKSLLYAIDQDLFK